MTVSEWYLKMKDGVSATMNKIGVGADSASSKFSALQANSTRVEEKLNSTSRAGVLLTDTLKGIALAAGITFGIAGVQNLGNELIDAGIKTDALRRSLKLIEGDSDKGAAAFDYIKLTADKLGVSFDSVSAGYKMIGASARGTKIAGQTTKDILEGVTMASAALGVGSEETKGSLLAISQIISKGKVSAEELRGQLGERLPGAFQLAARSMGMTTGELDKLITSGKLAAEDFLPLFAKQLKTEFAASAAEASNSLQAIKNRMENTFLYFKQEVADSLAPHFARAFTKIAAVFEANKSNIIDSISEITEYILELGSVLMKVSKFIYNHSTTVLSLLSLYAIWKANLIITNGLIALNAWYLGGSTVAAIANAAAIGGVTMAWEAMKVAMALNPFGVALIAIAAVTTALGLYFDKLNGVNKELNALMAKQIELEKNTVKEIFSTELERVNKLMEGYKALTAEKARSAAINEEVENLRKAANEVARLPMVDGRMTSENQKKYDNLMTAMSAVRSGEFLDALKSGSERLYGVLDPVKPKPTNDTKIEDGINAVSGGGKQIRNVNVNIGNLVKELNVHSTNLKEGAQDVKRMIEEQLLRAIQGSELALGGE